MATKLKKLVLNEVSLVDRGANQHAHVTLFKRDGEGVDADIVKAREALKKSVESMLADESATKADLVESYAQYLDHLQTLVSKGTSDAVTAALAAHTVSKEQDMTDKTAEVEKKLADAEAALAKANKELAIAKMSDAHKAYATETNLEGEALDAYVAKSDADREAHIKAAPVVKAVDAEVAKRDAEIADLRKRVEAGEIDKAKASFAKRAVEIGMPETEGETLRKAHGGDKAAIEKLEGFIKGLTEQVKTGKLFEEFGTSKGSDTSTAVARVNAKVAEMIKSDPTLTKGAAIRKISTDPSQRDLWLEYKAAPAAA